MLRAGRFPNCRTLAEKLEVSSKTIQRDISYMRDQLHMPIAYEQTCHGYYYTRKTSEDLPLLTARHDELLALFLARLRLDAMGGTRIAQALADLLRRVVGESTPAVTFSWDDLNNLLYVKSSGDSEPRFDLLDTITRGLTLKRVLTFRYRKHGADLWEKRKVHPLHMVFAEGAWYLLAHDCARESLRTFSLQRMQEPRLLKQNFRPPEDFDPGEYLQGSFGIFLPKDDRRRTRHVHLRFRGFISRVVAERHWHSSQELEEVEVDGEKCLDMHLDLADLTEISRWVLGWGSQVEVLAPEELREILAHESRRVAGLYPDGDTQPRLFPGDAGATRQKGRS